MAQGSELESQWSCVVCVYMCFNADSWSKETPPGTEITQSFATTLDP